MFCYCWSALVIICIAILPQEPVHPVPVHNKDQLWQRLVATEFQHSVVYDGVNIGKKDWKQVRMPNMATLKNCCDTVCLTFRLPYMYRSDGTVFQLGWGNGLQFVTYDITHIITSMHK